MSTPENFDRVQAALGIEERPRTRRQTKPESTIMQDPQTLIDARAELHAADENLATVATACRELVAQIEAAKTSLAAEQRAMAETHQAAAARGLDFSGQLLVRQQAAEIAQRFAALEQSAFTQRAAVDAREAEAQARVNKCEAAVALELMKIYEAKFLDLAAPLAIAYRDARRAAWTVRQKLGRINTPESVSNAVFNSRFGSLPFFTSEGASTAAYATWAVTREAVTETHGVADQLRG